MHILPLSEFRANAAAALDMVEQGHTVRILRHGKPVADLVPVPASTTTALPAWKRAIAPGAPLRTDGKTAAQLIVEARDSLPFITTPHE